MEILDEVCEKGVIERRFNVTPTVSSCPGSIGCPRRLRHLTQRCSSATGELSTSEFPMCLVWLESSCGTQDTASSPSMPPDTAIG
jgi:hypothetical protein